MGSIVFNIALVMLGYYASCIDSPTIMKIDTNVKSNLIKIVSKCLQVLYPSKKYDSEITRQLDALIREFTREIKAIHRGDNTQDNLKRILRELISNMVHRALSETNTRFMIDHFLC